MLSVCPPAGARTVGRAPARCYNPPMFSGGSYEDVARWLRNFLVSHAKREDPRVEVVFEAGFVDPLQRRRGGGNTHAEAPQAGFGS